MNIDLDEEKEIERFFHLLRDTDNNLLVIKDMEDSIKRVQGRFSENE
jgi:hypothetical protein